MTLGIILKFKPIVFLSLLVLTLSNHVIASDELVKLYESHKYEELKSALNSYSSSHSYEIMFFKALFNEKGDEAKFTYEKVFKNTNGRFKRYSAKKLMDYYYANGYYETALKYQKYLVDSENRIAEKRVSVKSEQASPIEKLYIQVGAFGLRENASQLQNMLNTQNIKASIIEKIINGKKLYLVWIEGESNFENTLKEANLLREKYDLDYRIIKK